jgi:hypothetical protein
MSSPLTTNSSARSISGSRVRGHRDFRDRGAYEQFLAELARRRNATRE